MGRALTTLLAAGAAGFLLWLAAQFDMGGTGGYWAALGLIAAGGLLVGLAQLRGTGGSPRPMLVIALVPVAVCVAWVLVLAEPGPDWVRGHLGAWSDSMGIGGVATDLARFTGVLAFATGVLFGYTLEPGKRRRPVLTTEIARTPIPEIDLEAADEPLTAEREALAAHETETRPIERTKTTVR